MHGLQCSRWACKIGVGVSIDPSKIFVKVSHECTFGWNFSEERFPKFQMNCGLNSRKHENTYEMFFPKDGWSLPFCPCFQLWVTDENSVYRHTCRGWLSVARKDSQLSKEDRKLFYFLVSTKSYFIFPLRWILEFNCVSVAKSIFFFNPKEPNMHFSFEAVFVKVYLF